MDELSPSVTFLLGLLTGAGLVGIVAGVIIDRIYRGGSK